MILEFIGNAPKTKYVLIGVNGNNLVDDLVFIISRKQGKNDLYEFTPKIKITTAERDFAEYSSDDLTVEKIEERDTIKITYTLPEIVTERGNVDMQIVFEKAIDGGEVKTWQTLPFNVNFPEGIDESGSLIKAYPNVIRDIFEKIKELDDKYLVIPDTSKGKVIPYVDTDGKQKTYYVSASPYEGYLVTYGRGLEGGVLKTTTPTEDLHCANKKYVDNAVTASLGGDSVFIRYSAYADGTNFTETWSEGQNYIGIATGQAVPTHKMDYVWCRFVGEGADMSGYMEKPEADAEKNIVPYMHTSGVQRTMPFSSSPLQYALASYATGGILSTNEPTKDVHCANKKYVDDMIAANLNNSGGTGYNVTLEVYDDYAKGLRVSRTLPDNADDYDLELISDMGGSYTETLSNVTRLYTWSDVSTTLIASKDGDVIMSGRSGGFNHYLNNDDYIEITEDCTITITVEY